MGFDYRTFRGLEERDSSLDGHKQNFARTKTQRKGAVYPEETEPKLPAVLEGLLLEARVSRGCHRDEARKVSLGVNPLGVPNPTTVWVILGQTTTREGEQPNPSADNWSEVLLSRVRFLFSMFANTRGR